MTAKSLTLSVVSHGQRDVVGQLLADLDEHVRVPFRLVLTENIPEQGAIPLGGYQFSMETIVNVERKGFGANHNAAFARSKADFFCVLNPDIRVAADPFPALLELMRSHAIAVASPSILDPTGRVEDHARHFPTVLELGCKALGVVSRESISGNHDVHFPDWISGAFMLFRAEAFSRVGGFDEGYFLYYEDVDICAKLRDTGLEVAVCPQVSVVHAAQRASHRNLRYSLWHARSVFRFFARRPAIALGLRSRAGRV
jgi:N-acetylglucosaminyl-diphospho-decaprenol L-rhamnosyltransferase